MLLGWHYMYYYRNAYAFNQYLASRGFVVLSVNYRSGIGYGLGGELLRSCVPGAIPSHAERQCGERGRYRLLLGLAPDLLVTPWLQGAGEFTALGRMLTDDEWKRMRPAKKPPK